LQAQDQLSSSVDSDITENPSSASNSIPTSATVDSDADCEKQSIDGIQEVFADFIVALKSKSIAQATIDFVCHGVVNVLNAVLRFCVEPLRTGSYAECESHMNDLEIMCNDLSVKHSAYNTKNIYVTPKGLWNPLR
jgi:hypothetical protein